ncbi:hypothetical protein BXY75_1192 [Ulvibacter antarcticus]|uniref:Uncharacterized protein n=1 Tax=Ulvibacter antarcticus TaxID=442714 RepID=A0A3L9YZ17_9FLAO|nr:hypothetical protein BXY75_1192 [Ulvibacter antarcticus]
MASGEALNDEDRYESPTPVLLASEKIVIAMEPILSEWQC